MEVTFFDWPHLRIAPNYPGTGEVSTTELRVRGRETLDWWAGRFAEHGVRHGGVEERDGRSYIDFLDPEGQRLRLADDGGEGVPGGIPWEDAPVPREFGIRGLGAVDLTVQDLGPTAWTLAEVLEFRPAGEYEEGGNRVALFEAGPGGPGAMVRVIESLAAPQAHLGKGGVHHVAFRTPDEEEQRLWREKIREAGLGVTPQIDRYYFRSIYFREPGGILFEIATDGPGFATDEDAAHLGERLSLPPFLEGRRAEIEARLEPTEIEARLEPIPVPGGASRQ
jgi:glyoxalase family protein